MTTPLSGWIKSATTSAPPGSPSAGDLYIIPAGGGSGAWSGFSAGQLVGWTGTAWTARTGQAGQNLVSQDSQAVYGYTGTAWQPRYVQLMWGSATLNNACSWAAALGVALYVDRPISLVSNVNCSADVFDTGALITRGAYSLTFGGKFQAIGQVFNTTDTGNLYFTSLPQGGMMPEWWGAKADDATDSAPAFNALFNTWRTAIAAAHTGNFVPGLAIKTAGAAGKAYLLSSSGVNLTGLSYTGNLNVDYTLDFGGASFDCRVSSQPACWDALGDRHVALMNAKTFGAQSPEPLRCLQFGRKDDSSEADRITLSHFSCGGYFSVTDGLNVATEDVDVKDSDFSNMDASGSAYLWVQDGIDHFGVTSAFLGAGVTITPETAKSFNENEFDNVNFCSYGSGPVLWIANGQRHTYKNSYGCTSSAPYYAYIYQSAAATGHITDLDFQIHFETNAISHAIEIGGTAPTIQIYGLRYLNQDEQATTSIFYLDPTSAAAINDVPGTVLFEGNSLVDIGNFTSGNGVQVFDPDIYLLTNWTGKLVVPSALNLASRPPYVHGCLITPPNGYNTNNLEQCSTGPRTANTLTLNPQAEVDQLNEGAYTFPTVSGTVQVDGWFNGGSGQHINFQVRTDLLPPSAKRAIRFLTQGNYAPGSTGAAINESVYQTIEGQYGAPALLWGNGGARDAMQSFDFLANNAGTYCFYIANAGNTQTFVREFQYLTAGAWQHIVIPIPGDTSGNWLSTSGSIFAREGIDMGAGTNFNSPTPNGWTGATGPFTRTSNCLHVMELSGAYVYVTNWLLQPGDMTQPFAPASAEADLEQLQRRHQKSCAQGIVCTGSNQAATFPPAGFSANAVTMFPSSADVAAGFVTKTVPLFVAMAKTPTIAFASTGVRGSGNCYNHTQGRDSGAAVAVNAGDKAFTLKCTLVAGDNAGDQIEVQWEADAPLT